MPNQIAHQWVGEEVVKRLDDRLVKIVGNNLQSYRLGTFGPDFLFSIREVGIGDSPQYANLMQYLNVYEVFERCGKYLKEHNNDNQLAYMLGLMCHYIVDMRFHAYVNFFVEEVMPRNFDADYQLVLHSLMEAAIDEYVIDIKMEKDARVYRITDDYKIPIRDQKDISELYYNVINKVMGCNVSIRHLRLALVLPKVFFRLTTDPKGRKKRFFDWIENKSGSKKQISSSIRPPILYGEYDYLNKNKTRWRLVRNHDTWTDKSADELLEMCIDESAKYIDKFIRYLDDIEPLRRQDFDINYEGVNIGQ